MSIDSDYYKACIKELQEIISQKEMQEILSQKYCELDCNFLGFVNVYKSLSLVIPKNSIVIDFGCNLAAQSYFFANHREYIGVDTVTEKRFCPANCVHYVTTIQEFIQQGGFSSMSAKENLQYFAVCSYVPDDSATELVRKTFKNVFCFYPD